MIAFLQGVIQSKQGKGIVLNVNGVGYLVYTTKSLLEKVTPTQEISLHIHTNVREDDISLYGFEKFEEWSFFKLLLSVSGVGPKLGLEILNSPLSKIKQAIIQRDAALLTSIPGIGRKTGERIIVDLHGKIDELPIEKDSTGEESLAQPQEDIIQALVSLGYHRHQVVQGLKKIPSEIEKAEAIIKYFLQNV